MTDDIHAALRAKEAELRASRAANEAEAAHNAQTTLQAALRQHSYGAVLTGIDHVWLMHNEPHLWTVVEAYFLGQEARNTRSGIAIDRQQDYRLRTENNPLQPYLDRLARRTR